MTFQYTIVPANNGSEVHFNVSVYVDDTPVVRFHGNTSNVSSTIHVSGAVNETSASEERLRSDAMTWKSLFQSLKSNNQSNGNKK